MLVPSRRRVSTESWGHAWRTVEQPGGEAETREPKAAPRLLHSCPGQESNIGPAEATCDDNPPDRQQATGVPSSRGLADERTDNVCGSWIVTPRALAFPATTRVGLELGRQVPPRVIAQLEVHDVREHSGNVRVRLRAAPYTSRCGPPSAGSGSSPRTGPRVRSPRGDRPARPRVVSAHYSA